MNSEKQHKVDEMTCIIFLGRYVQLSLLTCRLKTEKSPYSLLGLQLMIIFYYTDESADHFLDK